MAGNRRSWSRGEPAPARPRSGPSNPARHHWAVVPAPARPVAPPERILAPRGSLTRPRPPTPAAAPASSPRAGAPSLPAARYPSSRVDPGPDPSEAENGALGGSFRSAPDRAAVTTAQSCGNPRAHPMGPPERSSRSAITGNRAGPPTVPGAPRKGAARLRRPPGQNPRPSGAHEAHGTGQGDDLSKSVAKAPRAGIGREKKRGISTILFRCSGSIRAFATDSDTGRDRPRGADVGRGSASGRWRPHSGRDRAPCPQGRRGHHEVRRCGARAGPSCHDSITTAAGSRAAETSPSSPTPPPIARSPGE